MSKRQNKIVVGLTGNIATGKSAVMKMAAEQGALTIDADKVVHKLMDSDRSMQAGIIAAFGSEVRRVDGKIDRIRLGGLVFNDPEALRDLEMMMHPAVRANIVAQIESSEAKVVVVEAIKLLEGPLHEECDVIWVADCNLYRQLQRLVVSRGMAEQEAVTRATAQSLQADKVAKADVVIDTNGTMAETKVQIETAWENLPQPTATPALIVEEKPVIDIEV